MRICAGGLLVRGDALLLARRSEDRPFVVTAWSGGGEPRLLGPEHSTLCWLNVDDALALPLAHLAYGELFRSAVRLARGGARR
jgi:hypothetical protein